MPRTVWLVTNAASGSNREEAIEELRLAFEDAGLPVGRLLRFPDDALPTGEELDAAGIGLVAVFAGDGTVNALITSLYGWGGAILVLAGGTMNLLFRKLHGERDSAEVIRAVAAGRARRCRPAIVRCEQGDGLAGIMAGPGTAWNDVREAMRQADLVGMASSAVNAVQRSVAAPMIACSEPALGRPEGYPLIVLTPGERGFAVDAYHSETIDEYLSQGLALLKRDFREGPSDRLGMVSGLAVESAMEEPIGLLIDGEPADAGPSVRFVLASCEVDLLAAGSDD